MMTSRLSSTAASVKGHGIKPRRCRTLPFELQWSFGLNPDIPILNLSNEHEACVAYACSHVVIIFDWRNNIAKALQGHRNAVKSLSLCSNGKWLMSADFGEDNTIVIWDVKSKLAACTLFNPHGHDTMTAARISPDAKYIVTASNNAAENRQRVSLWFWTLGRRDEPDLSYELADCRNDVSEQIKEMTFSANEPAQFACTSDGRIDCFALGDNARAGGQVGNGTFTLRHCCSRVSDRGDAQPYGALIGSCYLPSAMSDKRVLTATANGYVLLTSYHDSEDNDKRTLDREHVSSGKFDDDEPIPFKSGVLTPTTLLTRNSMAAVGNADGRVAFYDNQLKLVYWCDVKECSEPDPIRSISFDLCRSSHSHATAWEVREFDGELSCGGLTYAQLPSSDGIPDGGRNYVMIDAAPFDAPNFLVCRATGTLVLYDIRNLKYRFLFRNCGTIVTSVAAHPESCHVLIGLKDGSLRLYDYEKRQLILSRELPRLADDPETRNKGTAACLTRIERYQNFRAVTALTYSPFGDMVACGMENGAVWPLHPITLQPLEHVPYNHAEGRSSILRVAFDSWAAYMACVDDAGIIALFRRNDAAKAAAIMWQFIGKLCAHSSPIRDILFGPPTPLDARPASRLLSLGENCEVVEYDLINSGPYPDPGLRVLRVAKIESGGTAVPLCLAWYPPFDAEQFLVTASSEYKYRLVNDTKMTIRKTFLGPTLDAPIQRVQVLTRIWRQHLRRQEKGKRAYAIFLTEKSIGIQLLPLDGNPYKAIGIVAHPFKIRDIAVGARDEYLFTVGDCCVFQWKINLRSVDVMARQGGNGLSPYYCLIDGGEEGSFANEMRDFFYYAQILHRGENAVSTRIITDKVPAKQIPNLMRALGYYPSNNEIENMLTEIFYRDYGTTGQLLQEITFEEWVKLYVNHRPAFGLLVHEARDSFCIFATDRSQSERDEISCRMTREQFLNVLCDNHKDLPVLPTAEQAMDTAMFFGDPLTAEEAYGYLKLLVKSSASLLSLSSSTSLTSFRYLTPSVNDDDSTRRQFDQQLEPHNICPVTFQFLPMVISYKDFMTNIMGLVLRADETTTMGGLKKGDV